MTSRESLRYLLWAGAKVIAGDSLTHDELVVFAEARDISADMAYKFMRIKPESYDYEKGQPFI